MSVAAIAAAIAAIAATTESTAESTAATAELAAKSAAISELLHSWIFVRYKRYLQRNDCIWGIVCSELYRGIRYDY